MRKGWIAVCMVASVMAGCAAPARVEEPEAGHTKVLRQTDQHCMRDCLGNGGQNDFCSDRCTN
jgi:hypothetical protein